MHLERVIPFDEIGLVAMALKELGEIVVAMSSPNSGSGNLVAVEMENGQHRAIAGRIDEINALPTAGEGAGFGFPVSHDRSHQQVGIVHHSAKSVQKDVTKFSALMDRSWRRDADVARHAAGCRELSEKSQHAR